MPCKVRQENIQYVFVDLYMVHSTIVGTTTGMLQTRESALKIGTEETT